VPPVRVAVKVTVLLISWGDVLLAVIEAVAL
jgi:hypothetical protein